MSNAQVETIFQNILNAFAGTGEILNVPCEHCGSRECDSYIDNCTLHPDRVSVREAQAEANAIWNARFAKAQDAGKYGEEL